MTKPFDPHKPCERRGGGGWILDANWNGRILVGYVDTSDEKRTYTVNSAGIYSEGTQTQWDLVNIPEKFSGWVNVYRTTKGFVFGDLAASIAESRSLSGLTAPFACIPIEFEEGEGLS